MLELSEAQLRELRGAAVIPDPNKTRDELLRGGAPPAAAYGARAKLIAKKAAQRDLKEAINHWGAKAKAAGLSSAEAYRLFFYRFGGSVLHVQSLSGPEMLALIEDVRNADISIT